MKCHGCGYTRTEKDTAPIWRCPHCNKAYKKTHLAGSYRVPPEKPPLKEIYNFDWKWLVWPILLLLVLNTANIITWLSSKAMDMPSSNTHVLKPACTDLNPIEGDERSSPVQIDTRYTYVPVNWDHGRPVAVHASEKSFEGHVSWHVLWKYDTETNESGCAINRIRTRVFLGIYLPEYTGNNQDLLMDAYIEESRRKMEERASNVVKGTEKIPIELQKLTRYQSCNELDEVADRIVSQLLDDIKHKNGESPEDEFMQNFKKTMGISGDGCDTPTSQVR